MTNVREEQNSYLEYVKEEFLKTVKEKEEMSADYDPVNSDKYQELRNQLTYCASELIKSGIKCVNDRDNSIGIVIDGIIYDMAKEDIKQEVGDARFAILMKQSQENDVTIAELFGDTNPVRKDEVIDIRDYQSEAIEEGSNNPIEALTKALQMFVGNTNITVPANAGETFNAPIEKKDELQSLLDDVNSVQKKIFLMDQEKNNKIGEVEELNKQIKTLKQELADREERYSQESLAFDEKVFSLNEQKDDIENRLVQEMDKTKQQDKKIESLEKTIENLEGQVKKKNDEINTINNENAKLKKELDELKAKVDRMHDEAVKKDAVVEVEVNNAKETAKTAETRVKAAEEERAKLAGECEHLRKELKEAKDKQDKAIDKLNKEHAVEIEKLKATASKDSESKAELAKIRDELTKAVSEKNEIAANLANAKIQITEFESMKQSFDNLNRLAYTDSKTELNNNNAFNRDFKSNNLESMILSFVDIRNMREINAEHGKQAGDKVIKTVARCLVDSFSKDNVYRTSGDQFAIISKDTTLNQVQGDLVDLYNKLLNSESIRIAHGTAVGNNFSKHKELIEAAEGNLNAMKRTSNELMYDKLKDQVVSEDAKTQEMEVSGSEPEEIDLELEEFMSGNSGNRER